MKFEIDISDPASLRKLRAELNRLLTIVDFALTQHTAPHQHNGHAGLMLDIQVPVAPRPMRALSQNASILQAIQAMPRRFSTTDVVLALGDRGKESRTAIKFALRDAAMKGRVRVVERGIGRKPNVYEKTT